MKKTFALIAFTAFVGLASFAQDSSGTHSMKAPMHKKKMHSTSMSDSSSSVGSGSGSMTNMPMKKTKKKTTTSSTMSTDSAK